MHELIGKKIMQVFWTDTELGFTCDDGTYLAYEVDGDCCSHSYLYDFHGVKKLLTNGPVISVRSLDVVDYEDGELQCYGWEIVTESEKWGEQTSVFSFRNESNGYYGGWIKETPHVCKTLWQSEILDDIYGS